MHFYVYIEQNNINNRENVDSAAWSLFARYVYIQRISN